MTRLYFVRHGQTEWNKEMRFQGGKGNSELLPESYEDMAKLATFLSDTTFDAVYTSPLKRAWETADHVMAQWAKHRAIEKPFIQVEPRLAEVGLGQWEGMLKADVAAQYPEAFANYRHDIAGFTGEGFDGEGHDCAVARFRAFFQPLLANAKQDEKLLFFSHGMMLLFGISDMLQIPKANIRDRGGLSNTSTTVLETLDGGKTFTLLAWNQDDYLQRADDPSRKIV
jgi:probable phosphoglycerate mutase